MKKKLKLRKKNCMCMECRLYKLKTRNEDAIRQQVKINSSIFSDCIEGYNAGFRLTLSVSRWTNLKNLSPHLIQPSAFRKATRFGSFTDIAGSHKRKRSRFHHRPLGLPGFAKL